VSTADSDVVLVDSDGTGARFTVLLPVRQASGLGSGDGGAPAPAREERWSGAVPLPSAELEPATA
jgi:hypothetical protein